MIKPNDTMLTGELGAMCSTRRAMYSTASSMSLKPSLQLCRCIPLDPDGGADHMSRGGSRGDGWRRLVAPEAAAAPQVAPQRRDLSALLHGAIASPAS